jgi:hypothetical protein
MRLKERTQERPAAVQQQRLDEIKKEERRQIVFVKAPFSFAKYRKYLTLFSLSGSVGIGIQH